MSWSYPIDPDYFDPDLADPRHSDVVYLEYLHPESYFVLEDLPVDLPQESVHVIIPVTDAADLQNYTYQV